MKVAFHTLGCKVNQLESQWLEELFSKRGYQVCDFNSCCDIYIINTCCVTKTSEDKCLKAVRRARRLNPSSVIALTGCFSQLNSDIIESRVKADIIIGTKNRAALPSLVEECLKNSNSIKHIEPALTNQIFEEIEPTVFSRTRAGIKIEDGCDNFCSYCIIPYARGPVRSMAFDRVLSLICELSEKGYKEIVLTGIQISSYGKSSSPPLIDLLEAVEKIDGDFRIRLGSLNPLLFDSDFTKRFKVLKKVCPHIHLSLQSGCDSTLKRMNRKYTTDQYYSVLTNLRQAIPDVSLTTDIITGFPGESDNDFEQSLAFVKKCGFLHCHVFPYSERPGTAAASMPDSIDEGIRQSRAKKMSAAALESKKAVFASYVDAVFPVLFENEVKEGIFFGHSPNYIPIEAYGHNLSNKVLNVKISDFTDEKCLGTIL